MKLLKTIGFISFSVSILMALAPSARADTITFDIMAAGDFGSDNIGALGIATIDGLTLTMTAASNISRTANDPFYSSGPQWPAGTIHISEFGAGVQDSDQKGSDGISGKGGNKDEALILEFSDPIATATFYFSDFSMPGEKQAEIPLIYVGSPLSDGTLPSLNPGTIINNLVFHDAGTLSGFDFPVYSLNLSDPDLEWNTGMPSSFTQIAFRNGANEYGDGGEYFLAFVSANTEGGTSFHVAEPGTLILLGSGFLALAGTRIWKKRVKK